MYFIIFILPLLSQSNLNKNNLNVLQKMGTRSTYRFIQELENGKKENLVLVYFQYDGYPTGHPMDTVKWLNESTIVNGYGSKEVENTYNGMGCLTASFISNVKQGIGNVYVHPLSYRGYCDENYCYDIILTKNEDFKIVVYKKNNDKLKKIFEGTPREYIQKFEK